MLPWPGCFWASITILLKMNDSAQSFNILSFVQSPPPIQFPDLTVTKLNSLSLKKELR